MRTVEVWDFTVRGKCRNCSKQACTLLCCIGYTAQTLKCKSLQKQSNADPFDLISGQVSLVY